MSTRLLLIFLIVLSWIGGIGAIVGVSAGAGRIRWDMVVGVVFVAIVNALWAQYLHRKAVARKTEWALFGFLGNITVLLVHWFITDIGAHWSGGKSFFR